MHSLRTKTWLQLWALTGCVCLLTSACGFEPMYARHDNTGLTGHTGLITQNILIEATTGDDIKDRHVAEQFKNDLEDRLRPSGDTTATPQYALKATLTHTEGALAVSPDGTISRYNVIILADMKLTRISDGALVYHGQAQRTGSYDNINNAFYSTYVSGEDASKRTVTELAEDVTLRLATFFQQNPFPKVIPTLAMPGTNTSTPAANPAAAPTLPLLPAAPAGGA